MASGNIDLDIMHHKGRDLPAAIRELSEVLTERRLLEVRLKARGLLPEV